MFRNTRVVLILFIAIAVYLTGCAELKDKFIPKPKEGKLKAKTYYSVKEYDVKPSIELYTKRYIYWKTWHQDLIEVMDQDNYKKVVVAVEQDTSNLRDMQRMLVDEKAAELQGSIDEMEEIESTIKKEKITAGNRIRIKRRLETLGRGIKRDFSYNKMQDCIRDEFRTSE